MAGGAYDGGQTISLDKDPTKEIQHSIAQSRQQVALALANLSQAGSRDLLSIIQALIGEPVTVESMFEDFQAWLNSVFKPIEDLYANFEFELAKFLTTWNISLGSLSPISPNLQIAPEINSDHNVSLNSRWAFDPAIGDPSGGSLKVNCNGKEQAVTGTPIQVTPGQKVDFKVKFKWFGLTYSGNPLQLKVREIDTGKTVYLAGVMSPGTNGGFVEISGTYTTPAEGVTWVKIRPTISETATAGTVWIDSGAALKNGKIQQSWVDDLVQDFEDTWGAISGIFEAFGSINNEADFQNAVGKLLSLFGIDHPGDLGSLTPNEFWQTIWFSMLKDLGLIASQVSLEEANARQRRMAENSIIVLDLLHLFYPLGSPSDTPLTMINGRRTWWAAYNDIMQVSAEIETPGPGTAEATSAPLQISQRIIDAEDTISTVQQQVAGLVDSSGEPGRKYMSTAQGNNVNWGPNWTLSGNGTVESSNQAFAWREQASGQTIDKYIDGIFTGGTLLTDDGVVSAVSIGPIKSVLGADGPYYQIKGRSNADGTDYLFARAYYSKIQLGYAIDGVETVVATASGVTLPAGGLFELVFNGRLVSVRVNTKLVPGLSWNDSGNITQKNSTHRGGGQKMFATKGVWGDQFGPPMIRVWVMKDLSSITNVYGSTARFYRASTSGLSKNRGVIAPATTDVFDSVEYRSPNIELRAAGLIFWSPGVYRIQWVIRFSAVLNAAKSAAIVRNVFGSGVAPYAEGMTMVDNSGGLEGSFLVPVVGDGDATEAWYPGLDISGSGTYNVIGDGAGIGTWMTVEKVA